MRDTAQIHEAAVGQLLTSGQDKVDECRARRRARLRQHVHAAVRDARAVAEIEAGDARHVAHDERHRRVGDVTSGEVERLAAAQTTDGVVDAGPVIERRRQQVLDARVAHTLRPLQVKTDQQWTRRRAQHCDGLPAVAGQDQVRQTRQTTDEPRQLTSTDVRPAEVEVQRLTQHNADQVLLPYPTPTEIDDTPETAVQTPAVPRPTCRHAARQVAGRQLQKHLQPEAALQGVSCARRIVHVPRRRTHRGRADGVHLNQRTRLFQWHRWRFLLPPASTTILTPCRTLPVVFAGQRAQWRWRS